MKNAAGSVGDKVEEAANKASKAAYRTKDRVVSNVQHGARKIANKANKAKKNYRHYKK